MGKYNTYGTFFRTRKDICSDYLEYLIKIGMIKDEERNIYLEKRILDVEKLLLEKCYETVLYKGVHVSTLNAWWTFCNFVVRYDFATGRKVWNRFVQEAFLAIENNRNSCFMASRGLGKSYMVYNLYPAFKSFLHRGTKILLVSNIPQQCVSNLRILKTTIDTNELLFSKKDIYKGKDLKWTEREIEYNSGYILTLSAGTTPKGQHVNYCICDDILTDTSVYSDEEIENYILGQLLPCVQRLKGRMIVCGTPLHLMDIYHYFMNERDNFGGKLIMHGATSAKGFYSKTFPIITNDEEKIIYMPDVFSLEDLQQIRNTQGELKFQREYLLNCTDESATLFSEALINKCEDVEYEYIYSHDPNTGYKQFLIGADVATSGAASADYSAFVVLEIMETNKGIKKIIRNIVHEKGMEISGEKDLETGEYISIGQCETIENLAKRFNNAPVIVEKNNVGVAFIQELAKRNVEVKEFITSKVKKDGMMRYLVSEMNNRNIIIPIKNNVSEIDKMKRELLNFGVKRTKQGKERMEALSGHDDIVMALAIANDASRDMMSLPYAICQD